MLFPIVRIELVQWASLGRGVRCICACRPQVLHSPFSDAAQGARVAELDAINGCADLLDHINFEADAV